MFIWIVWCSPVTSTVSSLFCFFSVRVLKESFLTGECQTVPVLHCYMFQHFKLYLINRFSKREKSIFQIFIHKNTKCHKVLQLHFISLYWFYLCEDAKQFKFSKELIRSSSEALLVGSQNLVSEWKTCFENCWYEGYIL